MSQPDLRNEHIPYMFHVVPVCAAPCSHASEDRTLGQHVASRLVELGVTDFFCVPGMPHLFSPSPNTFTDLLRCHLPYFYRSSPGSLQAVTGACIPKSCLRRKCVC